MQIEKYVTNIVQRTGGTLNVVSPWDDIKARGRFVPDPDSDRLFEYIALTEEPTQENIWTEDIDRCIAIAVLGLAQTGEVWGGMVHVAPGAFNPTRSADFLDRYNLLLEKIDEVARRDKMAVVTGGLESIYLVDWNDPVNMMREIVRTNGNRGIPTTALQAKPMGSRGSTHMYVDTPKKKVIVLETDVKEAPEYPVLAPVNVYNFDREHDYALVGITCEG